MIDYGGGMIFPDSWAYGPPDPPEPRCEECDDAGCDYCEPVRCDLCNGIGYLGENECPRCNSVASTRKDGPA